MHTTSHTEPPLSEDQVRDEVNKILASPGFFRAARMQRFLKFVVDVRLAGPGHAEELKESVVGMAVFDREADYDPKTDPVVRVEARRLRAKLDEYYAAAGKEDAVRIDLPKGSYIPVWHVQGDPPVLLPPPAVPKPARIERRKPILLAGTCLLLALLLIGRTDWRTRWFGPGARIRSVAVLPFRNLTSDPAKEYLVSGLTDEITTDLAKAGNLKVISRTSSDGYRATTRRLPEIARELGVDAIIEGTVGSSQNQIRVTAQLIRAATDTHIWADTYERDTDDLFALQTEIAKTIAREIGVSLSPSVDKPSATQPTSPAAYEAYLRGRYLWNKRTLEGLEKSIDRYREAIRLDPTYAKAYAAMGDAYVLLGAYGGPDPSESLIRARVAAEQALRLDPSLAEAHTVLAAVKTDYDWDWAGATAQYKRAIQLGPNYPTAHHWYALHLSRLRHHKEAETEIKKALELDPLSLILNTDAGEVFYTAGNPAEALLYLQKALELDSNFAEAHLVLGKVYEQQKKYQQATEAFQRANALFGGAPNTLSLIGHSLALAGKRDDARASARQLESLATRRYVSGVDLAMIYCALGDHDSAMKWLDHAYQTRGKGLNILGSDPIFDGCRADPRFRSLLLKLKLG